MVMASHVLQNTKYQLDTVNRQLTESTTIHVEMVTLMHSRGSYPCLRVGTGGGHNCVLIPVPEGIYYGPPNVPIGDGISHAIEINSYLVTILDGTRIIRFTDPVGGMFEFELPNIESAIALYESIVDMMTAPKCFFVASRK